MAEHSNDDYDITLNLLSGVLITETTTQMEHVDNTSVIGWEDDGGLIFDSDGNVV